MKSHTAARFRKAFQRLPEQIQRQAREAYRLFKQDPFHPSLRFKRIHPKKPIYSARIGVHYRAVGVRAKDVVVWFWVGPHGDYDKLISRL